MEIPLTRLEENCVCLTYQSIRTVVYIYIYIHNETKDEKILEKKG